MPEGAVLKVARGEDRAYNRNGLIAIAQALQAEWICLFDDDLVMLPDAITKLLKHFDDPAIEVVVGLSFMRQDPTRALWMRDGDTLRALPPPGELEPLESATFGGMLIRLSAIAKIERPYVTLGDDREFCAKLRAAGVQVWGDSSVRFGHTTDMEIWPHYDEANGWTVVYARNLEPKAIQPWGQPALQEA